MSLHVVPVLLAGAYIPATTYRPALIAPVVATYCAGIVGWRIHTGNIEGPALTAPVRTDSTHS